MARHAGLHHLNEHHRAHFSTSTLEFISAKVLFLSTFTFQIIVVHSSARDWLFRWLPDHIIIVVVLHPRLFISRVMHISARDCPDHIIIVVVLQPIWFLSLILSSVLWLVGILHKCRFCLFYKSSPLCHPSLSTWSPPWSSWSTNSPPPPSLPLLCRSPPLQGCCTESRYTCTGFLIKVIFSLSVDFISLQWYHSTFTWYNVTV